MAELHNLKLKAHAHMHRHTQSGARSEHHVYCAWLYACLPVHSTLHAPSHYSITS